MLSDAEKAIIRDEIAPLLQDGDLTLYLGAGVSIGTPSINGKGVPSSQELIKRICKEIGLSDSEALSADLPTAFGVGADDIDNFENFLIGNFTVSTPQDWQIEIFKHWWRAIFTTNIDDLAEKCIKSLSRRDAPSYNIYNYKDMEPVTLLPTTPPIVYLHGYIGKPNSGFIFDSVTYADATVKGNGWISKSALHIQHGQCVLVGSKFKESDIEAALRQRALWEEDNRSQQPKNWIILRSFTTLEKRAYEKRGIIPITATAEEFFCELFKHVQIMSPSKFLKRKAPYLKGSSNNSTAWFSKNLINVATELDRVALRTGPLSRFYHGDMPDWFYVGKDVPAHFHGATKIKNAILAFESSNDRTILINVIGALGSGKTTSCMMALAELSKTHSNLYSLAGLSALDIEHTWQVIKDMKGLVVIFIDASSSTYYAINALIQRFLDKATSCKLCFVAEERTLQLKRNYHHLSNVPQHLNKTIEINPLKTIDALSLYDKSSSLGVSYPKLDGLSREEAAQQIVDCDHGYKGDLLATFYDLSFGKPYQKKLAEEFEEIQNEIALGVFGTLSIVTASRLAIPMNYLAEARGITVSSLISILEHELQGKVYTNSPLMVVSARHHSIAEYHVKNSLSKEQIKSQIISLMECVSSKFTIEDIKHHPISYQIYRQTLSHHFLMETVFTTKDMRPIIDEIYSDCQRLFAKDGIFWLQYGRFLEKDDRIDDALHCFRKGLALYDSFQIRHALGQVLIKKYRLAKNGDIAELDEGIALLQREIDERGEFDSYPHTALGVELIKLCKNPEHRAHCLPIAKDVINKALQTHKEDDAVMNMVKRYFQVTGEAIQ